MWCKTCAFHDEEPAAAACRECARYIDNKYASLGIVLIAAGGLGVLSHYILTGRLFSGSSLIWVESALQAPYSIYLSRAYLVAVAVALASLVTVSALAAFSFGLVPGMAIAFCAGFLSGVPFGTLLLPAVAGVAAVRPTRSAPVVAWPILAGIVGALYYIFIVWRHGPSNAPLYQAALMRFILGVAVFTVALVAVGAVATAAFRYTGSVTVAATVVLAIAPLLIFARWVGPARLEAHMLRYNFDLEKVLNAPLPEGFVSESAGTDESKFPANKQLGGVFDTLRYVDAIRAGGIVACDRYLSRWAKSDDAPDIMLLKGALHNARVDLVALKKHGRLETYFDRVSANALPTYTEIVARFPGTPQAALARYYIAEHAFESGRATEAKRLLGDALGALQAFISVSFAPVETPPPAAVSDLFGAERDARDAFEARLYDALLETRRRISLIAANLDFGGAPLARLAALDPRSEDFAADAAGLLVTYSDSHLYDNITLTLAERLEDPFERLGALEAFLDEHDASDVRDRALLETAKAHIATDLSGKGAGRAELALRRLLADYPSSTYYFEARKLLARVTSADGRKTNPPGR